MSDEVTTNPDPSSVPPQPTQGILNKTLGDILQSNPQAQNLVMKSMGISQQQLQQMLSQAGGNPMMNMPIADLFKNGIVQQAAQAKGMQQVSPEQFQQMLSQMNTQNPQNLPNMPQNPTFQMPQNMQGGAMPIMIPVGMAQVPVNGTAIPGVQVTKPSFFQKLKGLFK
jgi:hypothetical protein